MTRRLVVVAEKGSPPVINLSCRTFYPEFVLSLIYLPLRSRADAGGPTCRLPRRHRSELHGR